MKFLLWKVTIEPYRLAKIQWLLFKLFGRKPNQPCGHTKSCIGDMCHQPTDIEHCEVINDGKKHEVVCKCCGRTHISSNRYINPYDKMEWIHF